MHAVLEYALEKGVGYAEVKSVAGERTTIEVLDREVKELSSNTSQLFSVRVLYKGGEGIAFSSKKEGKDLVEKALAAARSFRKGVKLPVLKAFQKKIKTKCEVHPKDISLEEKKKDVLRLDVRDNFKRVNSCRMLYTESVKNVLFENSEGTSVEWDDVVSGIMVQAFAKEGIKSENFYDVDRGHKGYEILEGAREKMQETMRMAEALLSAKHPIGGVFPVVADQRLGGVFAHEAVGHGCEADLVLQNNSLLKNKIGKKIGADGLTLIDDGTREGVYGWVPVDDEGVEGQKTVLIDCGVLKSFLHSRETAAKMNAVPTGNGRAESLAYPAIPRMRCTYINEGDASFEEMLSGVKEGYYLKGTTGGEVNPATGEFLFNAQYGFKVEKGDLAEMVKAVSLQGSILKILPQIVLFGKDLKFSHGTCGKNGQGVPVSDGAPHMLLEKAQVGGQG